MRIGIFGNTNNYPLLLCEALRERGHEVILVADSPDPLHRPENRRPEWLSGYPSWIVDGGSLTEWDYLSLSPGVTRLVDVLAGCDGLILNSFGPSLLPFLDLPALAFLTGSDLTHYACPQTVATRSAGWNRQFRESAAGRRHLAVLQDAVSRQRSGIRLAAAVSYLPPGVAPDGDRLLEGLGVEPPRRFTILMAETGRLRYCPPRGERALRVFCATRFTWKGSPEPGRSTLDYKGSDVMIAGLGLFKRRGGLLAEVRLVRKGLHLRDAAEMVASEGLADQVTWLDEMPLTRVWEEFRQADVVVEQLGGSMVGMAGMDAMAVGRPVIANGRAELLRAVLDEPLPVCQSTTAEEVCGWLQRLTDPAFREARGLEASRYARRYLDPGRAAEECVGRLRRAANQPPRHRERMALRHELITTAVRERQPSFATRLRGRIRAILGRKSS